MTEAKKRFPWYPVFAVVLILSFSVYIQTSFHFFTNSLGFLSFIESDSEVAAKKAAIEEANKKKTLDDYAASKTEKFVEQVKWIKESVSVEKTGGVSSYVLDSLRTQVLAEVEEAYNWVGYVEGENKKLVFPAEYNSFKDLDAVCAEALNDLEELKVAYDSELEKETQALNVLKNVSDSVEGQRVAALASTVGVSVPVYYSRNSCPNGDNSNACFWAGKGYITVTPLGYSRDDNFLSCILKHEDRHAQQFTNGQIEIAADGTVVNREWLEADASSYSGC